MARPFEKGNPGRPKGSTNKVTRSMKEMVSATLNDLQKDPVANMKAWAKANPTEFYKIAAKLIPTEITGENGGAVKVEIFKTTLNLS